jgi:hypothetical protein
MNLETVTKIKGYVALVGLIAWIGVAYMLNSAKPPAYLIFLGGLGSLIFIICGMGWIRGRRRIRELSYLERAIANGGKR